MSKHVFFASLSPSLLHCSFLSFSVLSLYNSLNHFCECSEAWLLTADFCNQFWFQTFSIVSIQSLALKHVQTETLKSNHLSINHILSLEYIVWRTSSSFLFSIQFWNKMKDLVLAKNTFIRIRHCLRQAQHLDTINPLAPRSFYAPVNNLLHSS